MVNTKLNSHEQNKKHAKIAKTSFRTFGESETEQEQFFRMSILNILQQPPPSSFS